MPTCAYVGVRPISAVATPMMASDHTSMFFRPRRSPKCPNTAPPNGRATNPTANVPYALSVPASESSVGKNSRLKTSAAAVP